MTEADVNLGTDVDQPRRRRNPELLATSNQFILFYDMKIIEVVITSTIV
jgi:ribosomal protein L13E